MTFFIEQNQIANQMSILKKFYFELNQDYCNLLTSH